MVEINLLPWRVYLKEHTKAKNTKRIIFLLMLLVIVWIICSNELNRQWQIENQLIQQLKKQLSSVEILDKQNRSDSNHSIENIFAAFQKNQTQMMHFFSQVLEYNPDDIHWQNMLSQGDQIILTGETSSYQTLMEFIKVFEGVQKTFHVDLIKVKQLPGSDTLQFSLQVDQVIYSLSPFFEKKHAE
jgi:Tfp pilus assembly protein PilN